MNKTIIININGIVFHIEEDAYEVLRNYMSEVKRHFAYSQDSEEIVTDIENRLAEMFSERLVSESKQVIVLNDVQEVTAQMGSVADFAINEEETEEPFGKVDKKLFRDTEDRMIGGVCSGIGHYFIIEPRWVRLFMLLSFFIGGSGLMLYGILWIVMPKAKTRADRMAMKGEAINLQNFKKTFDEEVEGVREGLARVHKNAGPALSGMGNSLSGIIKALLKILGFILIFAEAMALLGLVVGLMVILGYWNTGQIGPLPNIVNPEYRSALAIGIFLAISVPLLALILFEIRLLFDRKVLGKTGAFFLLIIWLTGLGISAYYGTAVGMQFSEEASFSQEADIKPMPIYYLKLNSEKYLTSQDSIEYDINPDDFQGRKIVNNRDRDFDYDDNIDLVIERADIDKPSLTREFSSRGPDFETALKSAQGIRYNFKQTDSILYFDRDLELGKKKLFRGQEVTFTLRIPKNTRLSVDRDLNQYIRSYNLWDCIPDNASPSTQSEWIMTENGLKCAIDSLSKSKMDYN